MDKLLAGSVAGLAATAPMTAAMKMMHLNLPPEEQYPLPPRQITMNVAEEVGLDDDLKNEEMRQGATMAAHFAYGAACGVIYGAVSDRLPGPPWAKGIGFGLAVWTGSYLGLLPATGLLSSAKDHPVRRSALMIAAHVVWGVTTGLLTEAAQNKDSRVNTF